MTSSVTLFELGRELAAAHDHNPGGTVTVIPVLVDDLTGTLPMLRALCSMTNGRLLATDDPNLHKPVHGTVDPVRRAAVVTGLSAEPHAHRHVVLVDQPGGLIDAGLVDPPSGPAPSPGEATVLAIARAAVHQDLDNHELAVVAYNAAQLDFQFRAAVWHLGVRQLAGLPHPTLRTLVVVAESEIDIPVHCQTRFGFRFAMDRSRLLRRHGPDDLSMWAASIAHSDQPFVLFLGAGFGASSRLPLGNTVRDGAIRRLLGIPDDALATPQHLAERFYDWIRQRPGWMTDAEELLDRDAYVRELTLEQVVRAEVRQYGDLPTLRQFQIDHDAVVDAPGSGVLDLAAILPNAVGRVILAGVNFDRLVEAHSPVELRIFSSDEEFLEAEEYLVSYLAGGETRIPYLKLHGSIDRLETCVVSAEQTEQGISEGKLAAIRALLHLDPRILWIYVGVSMRDQDLQPVFGSQDFTTGVDEVWATPFLADTVERYAVGRSGHWRGRDWRTIDDRLITETSDAFFGALRAAW